VVASSAHTKAFNNDLKVLTCSMLCRQWVGMFDAADAAKRTRSQVGLACAG
jgi:hypothetical protein